MVGVHQARGQSAVDVFRGLFPDGDGRAEAAALSFERSFRAAVDRTGVSPVRGAEEAITQLSDSGVRVCLVTGLSRRLLSLVLDTLGWWRLIDLTLCPDDVPRGCPWPDLTLTAMLRLGVEDVRAAAFAGCTASEVECGKRAGAAVVAGVLTGGHTSDRLRGAGATHLIDGITQLPGLLLGSGTADETGSEAGDPAPTAAASSVPAAQHSSRAPSSAASTGARGRRYP
jgi:phosphonatase-like hydrolase